MDHLGAPSAPEGSYLSPLLISLAIVACVSLLLIAYHLFLVKFCISSRRRRSMIDNSFTIPMQNGEVAIGLGGVEENVLKSIPILLYSKVDHHQTECVICLGELEDGDKVRSLPNCGHFFHVPCIDDWLSAHINCPICRAPIIVSSPLILPPPSPHHFPSILQESTVRNTCSTTHNLAQFLENEDEEDDHTSTSTTITTSSTSTLQSSRKLLHSLSSILPMEGKQEDNFMKLKRSLSMDECFVIIDIGGENDHEKASSSSSSSSSSLSSSSPNSSSLKGVLMENSTSYKERSRKQLDRVSSRFLRSFSHLRFVQRCEMPDNGSAFSC